MPMDAPLDESAAAERETASRARSPLYALKDGDTFVVTDAYGDIEGEEEGLFRDDTRILSTFSLRVDAKRLTLLSTSRSRDNAFLTAHMVNNPLAPLGGHPTPGGIVHIERAKLLWGGQLYERLIFANYANHNATLPLTLRFGADFADMFEVRGIERKARGRLLPTETSDSQVTMRYQGLDHLARTTVLSFSDAPSHISVNEARFTFTVLPHEHKEFYIEIGADSGGMPGRVRFRKAAAQARRTMRTRLRRGARLRSSGRLFNQWIERSRADLALLTTELPTGPYPYAGIPWFSTPFGRDAIVSALQTLWLDPALARGVLAYLAQTQAKELSSFKDSAPGKIMHETRKGEMTALGELPFGQYYGGVDTTPLFLILAGAYAERTGDLALINELWPALTAALHWIEGVLESSDRGLLGYARGEETSLTNQGWKDSEDSVFHRDGRMAQGPIALVEVQGYAFAAFQAMAKLAKRKANPVSAERWREQAKALRTRVERRFWMADDNFYALALDGDDALCDVRGSNPGHLLYVGLPSPERAKHIINRLSSTSFNTGWGLRTLAAGETRFNPMSYHNGSVWPHDTALCTAGMSRYGADGEVVRLLSEMFETAVNFDMQLPELFCGFPRAAGEPPIAYPVACMPQAWAAGAPFMMLQACLGVRIDGWKKEIHIEHPRLPIGIDNLTVRNLAIGKEKVDLRFERLGQHVVVIPDKQQANQIAVVIHNK